MDCQRCGNEMKPTMAFRLPTDHSLEAQEALECTRCGIVFVDGKWVDMRADPEEDADNESDRAQNLGTTR